MGTKTFFLLSITVTLLFTLSAIADDTGGRTADGCTYKVINGQYLTSCPSRGSMPSRRAAPMVRDQVHTANSAPVTDYGAVPMRYNSAAAAPSLRPQQHTFAANQPVPSKDMEAASAQSGDRDTFKPYLVDQTYVGLNAGSSSMSQSNAGSAFAFGLVLGTNLDETFGIELGYSYANQNLNLGLAGQGASTDPTLTGTGGVPGFSGTSTDSALSSNLFTAEMKANLTDPSKRLRPYLGAGLGWRSATLTENVDPTNNLSGGSLHQNALLGLGSVGTP